MNWGDTWRSTRVRMAMAVLRMLLGRVAAEVPSQYVTDLTEIVHIPDVQNHVTECTPWTAAFVEEYDFPTSFPLSFRRSHAFERRFIYRMTDVTTAPRSGVVLIPDKGRVMAESFGSMLRTIGWDDVRPDLLARAFDATWHDPVVLSPPTGYYHWLLEVLPRVLRAHDSEPTVKALVPADCPRYITDALALLGIGRLETDRRAVRLRDVLVPGALQASGFIPSVDIDQLRSSVLPTITDLHKEQCAPELIYVSRAKDARRALGNELAVEELAREFGFSVVYLQDLMWTEQVHRMSKAEVLVSPHGAGLANMIWSTGLSAVIEIFPFGVRNDCYARLTLQRGADYSFIDAEQESGSNGMVNLQRLKNHISSALEIRDQH